MRTCPPVPEPAPAGGEIVPLWIRLPRPGEAEPRTGLTRGVIARLCNEGKVKGISLADEGKKRGVRLVSLASLLEYLERLAAEQNPTK
jgi:hypothetical protein